MGEEERGYANLLIQLLINETDIFSPNILACILLYWKQNPISLDF